MLDRIAELSRTFETIHGFPPDAIAMVHIRLAARLASAASSPRTNAEQAVRATNALHRTLSRLNMTKPPKPAATHIPLRDRLRIANGHQP